MGEARLPVDVGNLDMNHNNKVSVSRFRNRNGVFSFRVEGRLNGVRIRRNFKTREEAAAEKAALEVKALQVASNLRAVSTSLTEVQVREAEEAYRRLEGRSRSLLFYFDFALANFREPEQQKPLNAGIEEYVASKQKECERSLLSSLQLRSIKDELKFLQRYFPVGPFGQLTPANLVKYLERGNPALKTYNNRRALISTFCKFALRQDWLVTNPIEKTPYHRIHHRRGSAVTISAAYAKDLMAYLETYENGVMASYFALYLFAGIRPSQRDGEIAKLRPEHIRMNTGVILIEPGSVQGSDEEAGHHSAQFGCLVAGFSIQTPQRRVDPDACCLT